MNSNSTIQLTVAGRTLKCLNHLLIGVFSVVLSGVLMTQNSVGQASITETILTTGNGSFVVPAGGLSSLTVQAWGGGGAGRGVTYGCVFSCSNVVAAGGGGGGGAYATKTISSLSAGTYSFFVGAGGTGGTATTGTSGRRTWFNNLEVVADSGKVPTSATAAGAAGLASACIPTANAQSGGAGGAGATSTNGSGGGGGGAGTTASGTAGSAGNSTGGGTGGAGGSSNGGTGATGRRSSGAGAAATNPTAGSLLAGAGGAGGWSNSLITAGNGGSGANGMIRFTYTMPAPTISSFPPSAVCGSGSSITITGTGFYGYAGTNLISSVTVNGVSATVTASNATSITFTVPVGASTGLITVTPSAGSVSSATNLVVTPVPSVPSGSITNTTSPACPSPGVTLSASDAAPAGVTWYWQTANNGQSTALGSSASSLTITSGTSQTRWLQAQDNSSLCWSATSLASSAVSITSPSVAISNTGTPAAGGIFMGANSVPLSGFQLAPNCIT